LTIKNQRPEGVRGASHKAGERNLFLKKSDEDTNKNLKMLKSTSKVKLEQ